LSETLALPEPNSTAHVLILHEVAEYAAWKRVFDSAAAMRKAAGEISYQVLRARENANHVVHFSLWTSHSDAQRFFQSEKLEEIRRQAGVKAPHFHYLHEVESGVLRLTLPPGAGIQPLE
jgi:quinol monooxygenase YgiN